MKINELLQKINGMNNEEQAAAIAKFYTKKNRKKTIDEARREVRNKVFAGCKKLSKSQQESMLYEFINANAGYINNWMHKQHPELRKGE